MPKAAAESLALPPYSAKRSMPRNSAARAAYRRLLLLSRSPLCSPNCRAGRRARWVAGGGRRQWRAAVATAMTFSARQKSMKAFQLVEMASISLLGQPTIWEFDCLPGAGLRRGLSKTTLQRKCDGQLTVRSRSRPASPGSASAAHAIRGAICGEPALLYMSSGAASR